MYKYSFQNDYCEGAHPSMIDALSKKNTSQEVGYGEDHFCLEAAEKIRFIVGNPQADVHFVCTGTQANLIMLSSCLKPFESVIAVESGHICVHETGAIEATGHKVNHVKGIDGKITVPEIEEAAAIHYFEHMVRPRIVYLSQSTELGTIYSAKELQDISEVCKQLNLYLYLDGARLGSALTSAASDIQIEQLTNLVDAFYIGGTKNGALLGEALVINHDALKPDLRYAIKQRGALLSKSRILGIQFQELFKDNLYFELARHANQMAEKMRTGLINLGYGFQTDSPTNQLFPVLPNAVIEGLHEMYHFYVWEKVDDQHSAIRLVTSWATPETSVDEFLWDIKSIKA
ncbi:MAG: low specificity L-threonine aldolase [Anaerolineaceae bacterium]|nr:low specificity L-threonine aldolase [Anaerolineaceae bacterium]